MNANTNCYTARNVGGMASTTTDVVAARVPKVIAAQVRDQAEHEHVTVSEIVHRMLVEKLREQTSAA